MLPWEKNKKAGGVSNALVERYSPNGTSETLDARDDENHDSGLAACAEDLIRAIHAQDTEGVASAFKAAFQILESEPHEEENNEPEPGEQI